MGGWYIARIFTTFDHTSLHNSALHRGGLIAGVEDRTVGRVRNGKVHRQALVLACINFGIHWHCRYPIHKDVAFPHCIILGFLVLYTFKNFDSFLILLSSALEKILTKFDMLHLAKSPTQPRLLGELVGYACGRGGKRNMTAPLLWDLRYLTRCAARINYSHAERWPMSSLPGADAHAMDGRMMILCLAFGSGVPD